MFFLHGLLQIVTYAHLKIEIYSVYMGFVETLGADLGGIGWENPSLVNWIAESSRAV